MNLFVLPSWYPSLANPVAGVFVRAQVAAVAAARPDWRLVVGHWGGHDGALSLRDARATARALLWRARARPRWAAAEGWNEAVTPRLSWTLAFLRGGAAGQLRASHRNLAAARQRLGQIDLIHAHVGFPAGWIAARLAAETGVPYVLTEHMSPFPVTALLDHGVPCAELRQAYLGARAAIAVGPALAARIRTLDLPCSDVVPNVVDERRFELTPPPAARPFVFLTLGALRPQKGVDLLLEAFARRGPSAATAELWIAGDGPERRALERQAAALGLAGRVRWLGAVHPKAVPALLARCHAFVSASRHETFGVVLAEALMCGRPVLATRSGGPEGFVHAGNGLLVAPGDAAALAAALQQMHAEAGRFDPQALRAEALARFGRAAVAAQLVAIYERARAA